MRSLFVLIFFTGCSSPVVKTAPEQFFETDTVTITANAKGGNKGLAGFSGPVYVHLGVITDSSVSPTDWRYVKFRWGSADELAKATVVGQDKWTYTIPGVRKFFGVDHNEKILKLAVLFRSGNCIDTFCRVLREKDRSDILIPISK